MTSLNGPSTRENSVLLEVQGVEKLESALMIALYKEEDEFLGEEAFKTFEHLLKGNEEVCSIMIPELPTGNYAISIFQDLNSDRQLNTNLLGIPKEPYGFSNNAQGRFGPPKFKEAQFHFGSELIKMEIRLR